MMKRVNGIKQISCSALKQILNVDKKTDFVVIDVRPANLYNESHIPKAINLQYNDILDNPAKASNELEHLNSKQIAYVICSKGISSQAACEVLKDTSNLNFVNVVGGMNEFSS
ncbi:hypothetical protein MHBO_005172 [Bonamia ostreae]|uniref:Rhodanese domain-containing protein n=1 Tax=Bonamia ostreae TaxID=126728 RepID=A0ABV2AW45_9EUKA